MQIHAGQGLGINKNRSKMVEVPSLITLCIHAIKDAILDGKSC